MIPTRAEVVRDTWKTFAADHGLRFYVHMERRPGLIRKFWAAVDAALEAAGLAPTDQRPQEAPPEACGLRPVACPLEPSL